MSQRSDLETLIERINNELNNLNFELSQAMELVRERITLFSDNILLIQLFASLNNYDLFGQNTREQIQKTLQYLTIKESLSDRDIQEAGQDLSEQLGRILEAKIVVSNIKSRLER